MSLQGVATAAVRGQPRKVSPELRVVKVLDMVGWDEGFLKEMGITKIETVFLYDANEVTYCCEVTPSYWMRYADLVVHTVHDEAAFDGDGEAERLRERACDEARNAWNMAAYESGWGCYIHCHTVDGWKSELWWSAADDKTKRQKEELREVMIDREAYERFVDEQLMEYRANPLY